MLHDSKVTRLWITMCRFRLMGDIKIPFTELANAVMRIEKMRKI